MVWCETSIMEFTSENSKENVFNFTTVEEIIQGGQTVSSEFQCRVIGYIISKDGFYFLRNIGRMENSFRCEIQLVAGNLQYFPPATVPHPVQIFGSVIRHKGGQLIKVDLLHNLTPDTAMLLYEKMTKMRKHLMQ